MKAVIFAGGVGTRLWPLSRKKNPKQFGKIVNELTMLQIAVNKLHPDFTWNDIFISTGEQYKEVVRKQLPKLPKDNIIVEPAMKDVGPAVGLVTALFMKLNQTEPFLLLWGSDHLVKNENVFRRAIREAGKMIKNDPNKIIFIGQQPRFANQNLGYIEFGQRIKKVREIPVYQFKAFQYRPHLSTAEKFFKSGRHTWNLGYFVTTPQFLWNLFETFAPVLFNKLKQINVSYKTRNYEKVLNKIYPTIDKISFDEAILEKMNPKNGYVLSVDIGWSDIGAWEALKEALQTKPEDNVIQGNVMLRESVDNLVYNHENKKLIVGIDLKGYLVVNTKDVLLITKKESVPKIKKLVESFEGTEHEKLT
ncbi:hypothetical protein A3A46_04130 [Candidatus Roizmanbacteria bacterium RIFCSPLOWO2_01_FULL_37_13]|uniref:Nucleotidyl transferase domain-containing protein n=1 Tax=Candidatus Roizmanbacteria bacterium RIFCSPHIGHO2_02_FULL_38_11 TaxID=1802039 RepID=A0A1F7H1U6_9BACT|nr:MAG: hypothetical protein A3C25_03310 [Candidatus Roizmanbacteria bacterium RIFCSPHIGHO2_02_FULL_38_11]OGK35095.1 MAG: hypothetical protein A3F58_01955 [Candidatus Roizmanbacteria bacterium RIFCSPHIGHO2_12_FULL_37_9b]OGK40963.1 MAG: hypothetical protein A3A46_04130 [Candidatus Roizmanbacteria bacterium RIFCSPLOWO2_01_FULL_37_13]